MSSRGFTLIELMVVVVIIGIASSLFVVSMGHASLEEVAQEEVRRAAALFDLAAEQAILEGREYAVHVARDSYSFYRRENGDWRPVEDDRVLRPRTLHDGLAVELHVERSYVTLTEDTGSSSEPQLLLYASGERTPFELTVAPRDRDAGVRLRGTAFGRLEVAPPERT